MSTVLGQSRGNVETDEELEKLNGVSRLLFSVKLKPLQGDRFQPTGFPNLGAASYQTESGQKLLVESVQSMANRLEEVCWDHVSNSPLPILGGISHVTVQRKDEFLTDSILESHRINSPYLLEGKDKTFHDMIKKDLGVLEDGPIDRNKLATTLLKYDVGSLIHGVFIAKKDLAGGRLRLPRVLSAFIEADGVRVASSGGVKFDHVNPSGNANKGFGHVPFSRDEFTAESIICYVNLDLAQIRGYGLGEDVERMLILLSLHRLRLFFSGDMRLRTACDLTLVDEQIIADSPDSFALPSLASLEKELEALIRQCSHLMEHTTVEHNDKLEKKNKESEE